MTTNAAQGVILGRTMHPLARLLAQLSALMPLFVIAMLVLGGHGLDTGI